MVQTSINLSDTKTDYNGWADWTTWNCALWINNTPSLYGIAQESNNYVDFLSFLEVVADDLSVCGATPDGADWGEADLTEMNDLITEIKEG
tara:strand:+ start:1684 stop:1956 length:273 start_codon:yes stop_codon:yes gene_type:complete